MRKFTSAFLSAILALPPLSLYSNEAHADWGPFETGELTKSEILVDSSTPALNVLNARVITDNDAAFQSKIAIIQSAKKTLRLVYYIFSNDHSSSVLSEELIAAARRGVKVKLLVDYHTNYKHLDLFSALQRAGVESKNGGGIDIRLFNRPTTEINKDARFLTSDCSAQAKAGAASTSCSTDKLTKIEANPNTKTTFSNLFVSGLYSKNVGAIQASVFEGGNIDLKAFASGAEETSPAELEQLKDFGRLVFDAKFRGSLESKIKLALAFSLYSEQLDPIYRVLSQTIPVERERNEAAKKDWSHLTDFIHHKLLVADDVSIQLGGRNIEDSYHTQPSPLTAKYTFMDTDMAVKLKAPDTSVGKSFDRIFEMKSMVASVQDIRRDVPNDMVQNMDQTKVAMGMCQEQKKSDFSRYDACVGDTFKKLPFKSLENRMDEAVETMRKNAGIYRTDYKPASTANKDDSMSARDASSMLLTYVENVPFDRNSRPGSETRIYGSKDGGETKNGKSIHSLWIQSLRNVCKTSYTTNQKKNVILHQGYVLFPGNMMRALGSMMNGDWDCRNVNILILTNSVGTTDLNVINFFARHQLKALVERASISTALGRPRIRVLEYKTPAGAPALSLHSKVNILGDDAFIGSANADVRSYYMDTNNGFFMRGANDFIQSYTANISSIVADQTRVEDVTKTLLNTPSETMINQDIAAITAMVKSKDKAGRMTEKREKMISDLVRKLQTHVFKTSRQLLDLNWIDMPVSRSEATNNGTQEKQRLQIELSEDFSSLMMLL